MDLLKPTCNDCTRKMSLAWIPKMRDEEIVCDFCEEEVPIVISLGTLWVCEACFDDAREQWTHGNATKDPDEK